jgi:hypothetical protein
MPRIASTAVAFSLLLALHIATVLAIAEDQQERNALPDTRASTTPHQLLIAHF